MPVMMIIGIKFGIATPPKRPPRGAVWNCIATVGYHTLTLKGFVKILIDAGRLTGMVLFIVAAAGAFGWTLTSAGLNAQLLHIVAKLGDSQGLFLVGSIVLLIVVGALLEGLPAIIILAPVLMPIANQLGID